MAVYDHGKARESWEMALGALREEGWSATVTGIEAPVQIEGSFPDGTRFFLHSRYDEVEVYVGGSDPLEDYEWSESWSYGEDSEASFLPSTVGIDFLREAFAKWELSRRRGDDYRGDDAS